MNIIYLTPESNAGMYEYLIHRALKHGFYIEALSLIHNTIEIYLKRKCGIMINLNLIQYAKECKEKEVINNEIFVNIQKFNKTRNVAIHKLLDNKIKYTEISELILDGRRLQLELSPCCHSKGEIDRILDVDRVSLKKVTNEEIMKECFEDFEDIVPQLNS